MNNGQSTIDSKNALFWNELCGSGLARSLGITEVTDANLKRFDDAYLSLYPYLLSYLEREPFADQTSILEIGLGYGTLGQAIIARGYKYWGIDIADGPVSLMKYRLARAGMDPETVQTGSALALPFPDHHFDFVISIGCLHHTGNLPQAVSEVYRVLKPAGKTVVMLYNRRSFRQLVHVPLIRWRQRWMQNFSQKAFTQRVRALYDSNEAGEAAPHTDYVSSKEVQDLFRCFSSVLIDIRNFDDYSRTRYRIGLRREWLLNSIARVLGLDLYITAVK